MKKFVSISNFGAIRILDVPFGASANGVKHILKDYSVEENNNCLYIEKLSIDNLPELSVIFSKDEESSVNYIRIGCSSLNQKECDLVYGYFRREFSDLNIVSKREEGYCYFLTLSNNLHKVELMKQGGPSNDENKFMFSVVITGRLIEGGTIYNIKTDKQEKNKAIKELYALNKKCMNQNKPFLDTKIFETIKVLFLIFALIAAYLFALNGRYDRIDDECYFDKWTKTILEIQRYKEIK